MPKKTIICYLFSILLYGMGYYDISILKRGHLSAYDFTIGAASATVFFVATIFLCLIGSIYYLVSPKTQDPKMLIDNKLELQVPGHLVQPEYGLNMAKRVTTLTHIP